MKFPNASGGSQRIAFFGPKNIKRSEIKLFAPSILISFFPRNSARVFVVPQPPRTLNGASGRRGPFSEFDLREVQGRDQEGVEPLNYTITNSGLSQRQFFNDGVLVRPC
jgi:hypothetical protein